MRRTRKISNTLVYRKTVSQPVAHLASSHSSRGMMGKEIFQTMEAAHRSNHRRTMKVLQMQSSS